MKDFGASRTADVAVRTPSLQSIQHREKKGAAVEEVEVVYSEHMRVPAEGAASSSSDASSAAHTWHLGPADLLFASGSSTVELLIVLPTALEHLRFRDALQCVLAHFACAAARRTASSLEAAGVSFSAVCVADRALERREHCLFEPPSHGEVLTLRIAATHGGAGAVGLCFDHALCDTAGAALLLAHVSARYAAEAPPPPPPHHDRSLQPRGSHGGGGGSGPRGPSKIEGGVVCCEWGYSPHALRLLKSCSAACTRHDAVFADVLSLLQAAGHAPLDTFSISRDERRRCGLPLEHFGNGASLVGGALPAERPGARRATSEHLAQLAVAVRRAVDGHADGPSHAEPDAAPAAGTAGVHLNTWWHSLQRPLGFGCDARLVEFGIGPRTLAKAARLCAARAGQPNVTVLPTARRRALFDLPPRQTCVLTTAGTFRQADGGMRLSLLVPFGTGRAVLEELRRRAKFAEPPEPAADAAATAAASRSVTSEPEAADADADTEADAADASRAEPFKNPPGAVLIWLHGRGDHATARDSPDSLTGRFASLAARHPPFRFIVPVAPPPTAAADEAVGASEGRHSSVRQWFEIVSTPLGLDEPEEPSGPSGLRETVHSLHATLDGLVADGLRSERILLGGFSQGGAAALAAALCYPARLAGVVCISGWAPIRDTLEATMHHANRRLPVDGGHFRLA